MNSAEDWGLSLVILSLVFACAALVRRWSRPLRKLFIPTAVIGGFLALGLGPEGVGRLTGGAGVFPQDVFANWKQLPGALINVMCAALLLGERLPPLRTIWGISGPHVIMAGIMSAGQFAVGGVLVLFLLEPVFGFNAKAGALIEMSFAGGHGTLAGLTPVLAKYGAEELLDVGLGLATIGMVTGIIIGTMLVNYAVKSPAISIARQNPTSPEEDLDIDHHLPGPDDEPLDEWRGMTQVTAATVFIGVSIAVGIALLELFRFIFNLAGSAFFEKFPLFPFTILGGVLVQICAVRFTFEWAVNRRAVEGLGGIAIDGIVICAIGTLSLRALGANLGPLIILALASVGWSVFLALVIGRRIFPLHWFEHSLAEFGESQGNVATGFVMLDMVDPARQTDVARAYSYRQLITRSRASGAKVTPFDLRVERVSTAFDRGLVADSDARVVTIQRRSIVAARRGVLGAPTLSGSSLALLFWWHSLTPTLIPRSWEMQVAIGAVCLIIGYGIGTLAGCWGLRLLERSRRSLGDVIRRRSRMVLRAAWLVGILFGGTLWVGWQNEQRNFMGMPSVGWLDGLLMGALSPLAGVFLVVFGRVIAKGLVATHRFIQRHVPSVVSVPATALLIVVLGIVLGRGVALRAVTAAANARYAPANEETTEGIVVPDSASVSGSSASLVAWDTLGRMGRDFVATATSTQALSTFHGVDAKLADPVRVYVGVRSADSAAERADLAIRELERAGGFDRKVLVVWVPTGTGWMIPKAAAALELLHRGDTAIVAIQYSYLPSLIGVFVHAGEANEAGVALFNAVHARWSELPQDRRPKLLLFGKSLGAAGVETPFVGAKAASSVANIVARTDGVLIAGASRSNAIHSQLTRERDPGSLVRLPVFDKGRSVRFLSRDPDQPVLHTEWSAPRIVYLQHGSDPVAFWSVEALWRIPEWMAQPRGFDVPDSLRWFPIVSSVQSVGDFLDQLGPPPGFGHDYSSGYVKGWASVVPPEGWAQADTERLDQFVDNLTGEDDSET